MKPLPKLQYISDGKTFEEQENNILSALDAGVQWIQLRWKNTNEKNILLLAEKLKPVCDKYNAIFVINDYPQVAQHINASGVHLGLEDIPVSEAKKILSPHQIIGGTANTLQDVIQRINENVDYIGLGPLRYTTTKTKLSPVLGYDGYQKIISSLPTLNIPIYAIGGVNVNDIEPLKKSGVYGIAVSSLITLSQNKSQLVKQINQLLYGTT